MAKLPQKIYEHSTSEELDGNVIDGMHDMLGEDILSSDYVEGSEWPGVNLDALPEAYKRPGQQDRVED